MSGKRGSNSRPSAWEADALPTELLPQLLNFVDANLGINFDVTKLMATFLKLYILFLIELQDGKECFLWDLHRAYLLHSFLSFLLFFKQLALT